MQQPSAASFNVPDEYNIEALVGQGAYGAVCKATHTNQETGEKTTVAIKLIPFFNRDTGYAIKVLHELEILHHFQAVDQIVCCHDAFVRAPPDGALKMAEHQEDAYLVMEYVETDLGKIFQGNQISSEFQVKSIVCQLLLGLAPMHARDCAHRDLKSLNILVHQGPDVRIGDFGLARFYDQEERMSYGMFTQWWRAPEILCDAAYTTKADIWAVGVMMAEMLTKRFLFPGRNEDLVDQLNKILDLVGAPDAAWFHPGGGTLSSSRINGKNYVLRYIAAREAGGLPPPDSGAFVDRLQFQIQLSDDGRDFLKKMLRFNPDTRMSAADALQHPWIQKSDLAGETKFTATEEPGTFNAEEFEKKLADLALTTPENVVVSTNGGNVSFFFVGDGAAAATTKASDLLGNNAAQQNLGISGMTAVWTVKDYLKEQENIPPFDFTRGGPTPPPQQIGDEDAEPERMQRVDQNVRAAARGPQLDALCDAIHAVVNKIHAGMHPPAVQPAPVARELDAE